MVQERVDKSPEAIEMLKKIKRENRKKFLYKHRIIFGALLIIIIAFIIYKIIASIFFYTIDDINTESMSKTINIGDKVYVDKNYDEIEAGKVYKLKKDGEIYYARCIGVGGDNIAIENDNVYINDILFSENYVSSQMSTKINLRVNVPEGEYFFLCDNRDNSYDSRYWNDRFVSKDEIIGEVTDIVNIFGKNKKITYY